MKRSCKNEFLQIFSTFEFLRGASAIKSDKTLLILASSRPHLSTSQSWPLHYDPVFNKSEARWRGLDGAKMVSPTGSEFVTWPL